MNEVQPMQATWIVVANSSRARIFSYLGNPRNLSEVGDMVNTAARLRTQDTESDVLGQHAASKSRHNVGAPTQPSGYEPQQLPAEHQAELFGRRLAAYLLQAQQQGRYGHLVLAAAPEFLGVLRKLLDARIAERITFEIDKDYTQFDAQALRDHIESYREKQ
jgi:protein required for attachment to host cells